jgi:hypothetical protein
MPRTAGSVPTTTPAAVDCAKSAASNERRRWIIVPEAGSRAPPRRTIPQRTVSANTPTQKLAA